MFDRLQLTAEVICVISQNGRGVTRECRFYAEKLSECDLIFHDQAGSGGK